MEAQNGRVLGISVMTCLQAVRAAGFDTSQVDALAGSPDELHHLWIDWRQATEIFDRLEASVPPEHVEAVAAIWVKRHPTWRAASQFATGADGWLDMFWKTNPTVHPVMDVRWQMDSHRLSLEARLRPALTPSRWWFKLLLEAGRHAPTLVGDRPLEVLTSSTSETHLSAAFVAPKPRLIPGRLTNPTDIPLSTIFEGLRLLTNNNAVLNSFRDGALPPGVTPVADGPVAVATHFKLTPAEARVLKELAEGLAPIEIAQHLGVAVGTVRVHLRHVFAKTRTKGQRELLRLVEQWTIR